MDSNTNPNVITSHVPEVSGTCVNGDHEFASLLECAICLSLIVEPITISCGHSFCAMCLVKTLRTHKKKWYLVSIA
jgi:hypothetical protein